MTSLPTVTIVDGTPRVSSLAIAEHFQKPHADVLKAIRKIMDECPAVFRKGNFSSTFRTVAGPNNSQRQELIYTLTRDAFSLVAMGFTGKKALSWKIRYIQAFNAMEKALSEPAQKAIPTRQKRQSLTDEEILSLLSEDAKRLAKEGKPLYATGYNGVYLRKDELNPALRGLSRRRIYDIIDRAGFERGLPLVGIALPETKAVVSNGHSQYLLVKKLSEVASGKVRLDEARMSITEMFRSVEQEPQQPDSPYLPASLETLERDILDVEKTIEMLCTKIHLFTRPSGIPLSVALKNGALLDAINDNVSAAKNSVGQGYFLLRSVRKLYAAIA